jgi:hypothetical protein
MQYAALAPNELGIGHSGAGYPDSTKWKKSSSSKMIGRFRGR